jgi:hypothetical protein
MLYRCYLSKEQGSGIVPRGDKFQSLLLGVDQIFRKSCDTNLALLTLFSKAPDRLSPQERNATDAETKVTNHPFRCAVVCEACCYQEAATVIVCIP